MTRSLLLLWLVALPFALTACEGAEPMPPTTPSPQLASGSAVERFFPLDDGKIYNYVTKEGGETGMLVAKVRRTDATHGELRMSNATKRFVFLPDAVTYDNGGALLLKAPLAAGTSWPGEHGGTTKITSVDAPVEVPAGRYSGCLVTVEEGGRPPGARYETTFCPGVGMVLLVVTAGGAEARAELKSYAAPVKIE